MQSVNAVRLDTAKTFPVITGDILITHLQKKV